MLVKKITFTNPFTDQQVTETHYFHLSKADLVKMQLEEHGLKYTDQAGETHEGLAAKIKKIQETEDGKAIMAELDDVIKRSYGLKNGDSFDRSPEISEKFVKSEAYSELFFELCTNPEKAAEFMAGIVPGNLDAVMEQVKAEAAKLESEERTEAAFSGDWQVKRKPVIDAATPENPVEIDHDDLANLTPPELQRGLADGRFKISQ